jgi:hypothetical protein
LLLRHLRERLRGTRDPLVAAAVAAGVTTVAIKVALVAPDAAGVCADRLTTGVAATFWDLGTGAFVVSGLTDAVLVPAASLAGLGVARPVPAWLAWPGVVIGVAGLVRPTVELAHPGADNRVPWLLGPLWTAVLGVAWAVRRPALVPSPRLAPSPG